MDIKDILKPHTLNEDQSKLLGLLKKFDSKCRSFGITYYLGGGTALGAVRHRGFLPWDDDVDLYISRDNYLKLLDCKDDFFDDDFVLVSHDTFSLYRNTLIRLVDTESTAVTKARIADDAPKGQFLELFIMDPMPVDEEEKEAWLVKHWIYTEIFVLPFKIANERIHEYLDMDLYEEYKKKCEEVGTEKVLQELEDELFSIEESQAKEYCSRWGIRNLIYDIEWYGDPQYVDFEDTKLPVPSKAERVLRFDYGDSWMYIPEVEEQVVHTIASDMNVSYRYYLEDFLKDFNHEEIVSVYPDRKQALINKYMAGMDRKLTMQNLQTALVELEAKHLDLSEIKEMQKQGNYEGILEKMQFWYDAQCGLYYWPIRNYLSIGDELLGIELSAMLANREFSKVLKVIQWRKRSEGELSEDLKNIEACAMLIREAYTWVDEGNYKKLEEVLTRCSEESMLASQWDCKYLKAVLDVSADDADRLEKAKDEVTQLLEDDPENGQLIALLANIEEKTGKTDLAIQHYAEAFERTNHGLVRLQITDTLKRLVGRDYD